MGGAGGEPSPINLGRGLPALLGDDSDGFSKRDPETFAASQIGFCPRQAYLAKLGLADTSDLSGRFSAGHVVRDYIVETLHDEFALEIEPSVSFDAGDVRFIGRCTAYDPDSDTVYHVRTRNGWYKFHPPVDRHIDQLHIYMRGLEADRGQLVYVSLTDLADIKTWAPSDRDDPFLVFDDDRFARIVEKAERICSEIISNGIATAPDEIPFDQCGCYFCSEETLDFPEPPMEPEEIDSAKNAFTTGSSLANDESVDSDASIQEPVAIDLADAETHPTHSSTYHVPEALRRFDIWVVWDCQTKVALAPWETGTMYPVEWAAEKDVDPRRAFEKARIVARMSPETIHASWPFPDADDLPGQVTPAVLLPHTEDRHDPPLCFVDFDDVRDPHTGETSREAVELIEALGGYTEISRSGTGLHTYVRASLPDGLRRLIAPLEDVGSVEIYDRSRFTGGTWRQVDATPPDHVPVAQPTVTDICRRYSDTSLEESDEPELRE